MCVCARVRVHMYLRAPARYVKGGWRCCDGWQAVVLDASIRHATRVNRQVDRARVHVSVPRMVDVSFHVGACGWGPLSYRVCRVVALCDRRYLHSTSLSGTLPESIGKMTKLSGM